MAISLGPSRFMQFVLASARLRRGCGGETCSGGARWSGRIVRPRRLVARRASFLAPAPGLCFFHGLALRRGGMTASAPRPATAPAGAAGAAGAVGARGLAGGDRLVRGDLPEQVGQHGRVADAAAARKLALDRADLEGALVGGEVELAPDAPARPAMLAGEPLADPPHLDAGAVDRQVQRTASAPIGQLHRQGLLTSAQRREVRPRPVRPRQLQQAGHEPVRQWARTGGAAPAHPPQRQAEPPRGCARSGLKRPTGSFPGRPSPSIVRHARIAASEIAASEIAASEIAASEKG